MLRAAERATELTRGLLVLARPAPPEPAVVDLADVVRDVARLLPPLVGAEVDIRASMPDEPDRGRGRPHPDREGREQLAVNASDAMPDGGTLDIGGHARRPRQRRSPRQC